MAHPAADLQHAPFGIVAVNLDSAESERRYRAVMGFLGQRYSRPDKKYGLIGGFVIGNEVQSHWSWHNMGEQSPSDVIRQYADQLRLSYLALSRHAANPRVFISMDHFWMKRHGKNPKRAIPGRRFLDLLAKQIRDQGDFPWHVAFHPYPESLFHPAFWNDQSAWYSYDTPRITFKNIEVLSQYLRREALLYNGRPRRLILSEQGFHAGDDEASEQVQAAAFAASYVRVAAIEGIDAYILRRHVDHPKEGGLKLGLRRDKDGQLGDKRLIYSAFGAAGTPQQNDAFAFALPIIGMKDWSKALPRQDPVPAFKPTKMKMKEPSK